MTNIQKYIAEAKAEIEFVNLKNDVMPSVAHFMRNFPVSFMENQVVIALLKACIAKKCDNYWGVNNYGDEVRRCEQDLDNMIEGMADLAEFEQFTEDMTEEEIDNLFIEVDDPGEFFND